MTRLIVVSLTSLLFACSDPASLPPPPVDDTKLMLPTPAGPHAIGVVDFELVDNNRDETFAPGEPRRIPVRAWFPASSVSGDPKLYASAQEIEHVIRGFSAVVPQTEESIAARKNLPTHSYGQAVPLTQGPRPTVIFSHGGFGYLGSNTALMEHLASHGYLVLSISHPYLSAATIHENGEVIAFNQGLLDGMMAAVTAPESTYLDGFLSPDVAVRLEESLRNQEFFALAPHFKIWQKDFMHVIDRLESGDVPGKASKLLPLVDLSRLGVFGMSFGASGSATAHQDARIKAAINLDGGVFDSALVDMDIGIPVLVMHNDPALAGMPSPPFPHSEFVYEPLATMGTNPDIIRVETKGATHMAYTDNVLLPASVRAAAPDGGASLGTIDGPRMGEIMNQFVLRFFDYYLSGEGPGLDATFRAQYPEVIDLDFAHVRDYAAGNPEPGFMSQTHVFQMNRRLAVDEASKAAAARLDRTYIMAYELTDSLRGGTEWWQLTFDPESGLSFSLDAPEVTPDLTFGGEYSEYIRFMKSLAAGEASEEAQPLTVSGDPGMLETVGEAFAAGRAAATIKTVMPALQQRE